ncbi:MAG: C1 family peptidase [Planctomycetes bacterium]|nr:C1 family peptidase [Planctomycetota bacterium]
MSTEPTGALTPAMLESCRKAFSAKPHYKVALNAVTKGNLNDIAVNRDVLNDADMTFSIDMESGPVTDQKGSGVCWLYAELNWLRTFTNKKLQVKGFEFSENHVMFWDKMEKANFFLENVISLRNLHYDDRRMAYLLANPAPDGGEWNLLVNVIEKHGLVPKVVMPDTVNRENSRYLNFILNWKLREAAATIQKMHRAGKALRDLRVFKEKVLAEAYKIIAIFMGEPPAKFSWSFRKTNKAKTFVRWTDITPKQFAERALGFKVDDPVVLIHCPMRDMPYEKTYTVEFFNNMWGGKNWVALNLPLVELKKIAVKTLKSKEAALFGCEVRLDQHSKEGIADPRMFDYGLLFDTTLGLDKGERLEYGQARMTHSMVFTGVDLVGEKPLKWKVENSWGDQFGKKGFWVMHDAWFDEHVMELIVPRKYLSKKHLDLLKAEPVVLPPWHPLT